MMTGYPIGKALAQGAGLVRSQSSDYGWLYEWEA